MKNKPICYVPGREIPEVFSGVPSFLGLPKINSEADLKDYDLVVLAPQVANYYEDLKKDTDRIGIKCVACEGKKYIELTRNPQKALQFVFSILDGEE